MKIRRKIWSLPLMLVTALLLVGMLGAVVLAQTFTATSAPVKTTDIPQQSITIDADGSATTASATVEFDDVLPSTAGDQPAFRDFTVYVDDNQDNTNTVDPITYVAMTNNRKVAGVEIAAGDNNTVVQTWWDSLDGVAGNATDVRQNHVCGKRLERLGLEDETTANTAAVYPAGENAQPSAPATGFCLDFSNLTDANLVRIAFHWDMLDAAQMKYAAKAGGAPRYDTYGVTFGNLSRGILDDNAQQAWVQKLFTDGVIAMGGGDLTLNHYGINGEGTDGEAGTTQITVNASDAMGRFVDSSSGVIGQTFDIKASLTALPTDTIPDFTDEAAEANFLVPSGTANAKSHTAAVPAAGTTPAQDAYVTVKVSPGTTNVLSIDLSPTSDESDGDAGAIDPHHQKINFSLTNGNVDFQVKKTASIPMVTATEIQLDEDGDVIMVDVFDRAIISAKSGVDLQPGTPYKFTLVVNELDNAPTNSQQIEVRVQVVLDNVAPTFGTGQTATGDVPERASEHEIATFTGSDPNNQVLTYSIDYKALAADSGAKDDEVRHINETNAHGRLIEGVLDKGAFRTTGVLKTLARGDKAAKDQPKFYSVPTEDDPDTADDETDPDYPPVNSYTFVIKLNDGTLNSVGHEFTLTVIDDEDDPLPGSEQVLSIAEDNNGGEDNVLEPAVDIETDGTYDIDQQIHTRDGRTYIYEGAKVETDGTVSLNDEGDILFDIDGEEGGIYLKDKGSINFEDGATTFTLAVSRGERSKLIVINVVDVDEAPVFDKDDKDLQKILDPDLVKGPERNANGDLVDKDGDVIYDLSDSPRDRDGNYTGGDVLKVINLYVLESAAVGDKVRIGLDPGGNPRPTIASFTAKDEDDNSDHPSWSVISYDLLYDSDLTDDEKTRDELYASTDAMVSVGSDGSIVVNRLLNTDGDDADDAISLTLRAFNGSEEVDEGEALKRIDTLEIRINVIDTNVAPVFDEPSRLLTHATVSEGAAVGTIVHTYRATDEDGDTVRYRLRDEDDAPFFSVEETMNADNEEIGVLKTAAGLDYETSTAHTVEIQAYDTDGDTDEIVIEIEITNVNDEVPVFDATPRLTIPVAENTPRGTILANYSASDGDGDTVTYSLEVGGNSKSFYIDSATGDLKTLESLDYDSNTPCPTTGCSVTIIASDGTHNAMHNGSEPSVTITVSPVEDSVSTLSVTKANPVPGTTMGDAMTALGNTKESIDARVPERPADLPNAYGAPMNFVESDWANWGTVLRIEVTAQSPDANCGSGNECVVISLNSDSADDTLKLQAYRMDTPAGAASNENKFVAAVMLVELDGDATNVKDASKNDIPVYKHDTGNSVARLQVDEEDEIEIEFYNLRGDVEVENEAPEISNFAPEHESAFDDPDVEYTFTVVDSHSGLPEPEDLPDVDGDADYMPAVALISKGQCETADSDASAASKARELSLLRMASRLSRIWRV